MIGVYNFYGDRVLQRKGIRIVREGSDSCRLIFRETSESPKKSEMGPSGVPARLVVNLVVNLIVNLVVNISVNLIMQLESKSKN